MTGSLENFCSFVFAVDFGYPVINCRSSSSGILFDVSYVVGFFLAAG